jgi:UDP-N-acetylglucosamine acyltransferase
MKDIHPTVVLGPNVTIEDDVYIGPFCIIGMPAEWKGKEHIDKGVIIKSGTRITGLVTIDSGVEGPTIIQNNCYLMKHSHVGHDALIGKNVIISCGAKVGGHAVISDGCNLGLNSVIHQKVIVPEGCMIGASAFVGKKSVLEPFRKYAGVPVKDIGSNVRS